MATPCSDEPIYVSHALYNTIRMRIDTALERKKKKHTQEIYIMNCLSRVIINMWLGECLVMDYNQM